MLKRNMRLLSVLLAFLALLLAGCGTDNDYRLLSIHDDNGNIIYYGMARTEVERILGTGEVHAHFSMIHYYDNRDIQIYYRNNRAVRNYRFLEQVGEHLTVLKLE